MNFKSLKKIITILTALTLLLSCAKENEPKSDVKKIDAGLQKKGEVRSELYCLSNLSSHFVKYFSGNIGKDELAAFWNCTGKAVEVFKEYAKPDSHGNYPAYHVRNFLQEYFWKDIDFNDELLAEMMYLKKVLFGGSEKHFSSQDFERLQVFLIRDMKELTVSLVDEIPFLISGILTKKNPHLTEVKLNTSIFKFRRVMAEFGQVFSREGYPYSFKHLSKLLIGLKPLLLSEDKSDSFFSKIEYFVPILQETKVLLVGPDRTQILASEWSDFFVLLANAYSIWLRSVNYISGNDFTNSTAL